MRGKGEGSIFKDGRGLWTAVVELPPGIDGKRRRRTIRSKVKQRVIDQLRIMQGELAEHGDLPTTNQTVEQWLRFWLDDIASRKLTPNTVAGYRGAIRHIALSIGTVRLARVTPAHVRQVHHFIVDALELSSTTALLAHQTMSVAFKVAVADGRLLRNPCDFVEKPTKAAVEVQALTLGEALDVLEFVKDHPLGAVTATSLLTAARRGEVIGLERDRVGEDLDYSWQLQRISFQHGCGGTCGQKWAPSCPQARHVFPQGYERRLIDGGLFWTRPKSKKGWRIIPLVEPLKGMLEQHIAFTEPNPWNLMFDLNGRPLDPDDHSARWRDVLAAVGIDRDIPLHGVRHTTIDLLYLAGVPEDIIVAIAGHSSRQTTRAYRSRVERARLESAMQDLSSLFTPRVEGTRPAAAE